MQRLTCPHCEGDLGVLIEAPKDPLRYTRAKALPDRLYGKLMSIVSIAAEMFGTDAECVMSRSREASASAARRSAMAAVRERFELSYPVIGDLFDRDHSTVMTAIGRADGQRVAVLLDRFDAEEAAA